MKLSEVDLLDVLRRLGEALMAHPECFTGNVRVNSFEGGVTNVNVEVSYKVKSKT